jgi:hypothetical protein
MRPPILAEAARKDGSGLDDRRDGPMTMTEALDA